MLFFIPVDSTQIYAISKYVPLLTQSYCNLETNALSWINCVAIHPTPCPVIPIIVTFLTSQMGCQGKNHIKQFSELKK